MEDLNVSSGNEGADASGNQPDQVQTQKQKDVVAYETHQKLLSEKKRRDEELRSVREQLEALQSQAKERETNELKQKEDFKRLYDLTKEELEKTRGKLNETEGTITKAKKYDSFFTKLGVDIPQKFWSHVPLESLVIDDSGRIDDLSLDAAVNEFRNEFPEIISHYSKKSTPGLPNQAAKGLDQSVALGDKSASDLAKILGSMLK